MTEREKDIAERIQENTIFLDAHGKFPKRIIIFDRDKTIEYRLVKTRLNKFQLNK